MRLGILETDHLIKKMRERYGSYAEMFEALLSRASADLSFRSYDVVQGEYPEKIDDCDAYLITGSQASPYDGETWIRRLEVFILELHLRRQKLIGICFGHQLIAQALGGEVQKSEKGWGVGLATRGIVQQQSWMTEKPEVFNILVSHQDQVTELPPGARLIAGDTHCPKASFQLGQHILTFQGHPEFNPDYLRQLIAGRKERIGAERSAVALDSLEKRNDHDKIAGWIVAFLQEAHS